MVRGTPDTAKLFHPDSWLRPHPLDKYPAPGGGVGPQASGHQPWSTDHHGFPEQGTTQSLPMAGQK